VVQDFVHQQYLFGAFEASIFSQQNKLSPFCSTKTKATPGESFSSKVEQSEHLKVSTEDGPCRVS